MTIYSEVIIEVLALSKVKNVILMSSATLQDEGIAKSLCRPFTHFISFRSVSGFVPVSHSGFYNLPLRFYTETGRTAMDTATRHSYILGTASVLGLHSMPGCCKHELA